MAECIPNVIERKKWFKDTRQLQFGDHVLIIDENAPCPQYQLFDVGNITTELNEVRVTSRTKSMFAVVATEQQQYRPWYFVPSGMRHRPRCSIEYVNHVSQTINVHELEQILMAATIMETFEL